ncbi:WD40-repeat-containing domain protein [Limtongia smithiae]|uniref:WD40-repeat-containing domain protein n=1 Tax=Limtongia smithiae TaxID=1125753 RepID=UPI0034CEDBAF
MTRSIYASTKSHLSYTPSYVLSLATLPDTTPAQLVASLSDNSLRVLDTASSQLREVRKLFLGKGDSAVLSGGVCVCSDSTHTVITASADGLVRVYDLRGAGDSTVAEFSDAARHGVPLTTLAYSALTHTIAVGTELAQQDARVLLFDLRSPSTTSKSSPAPLRIYADSHSDDVTALAFHGSVPHALLSGSTDGLITRYNTIHADEDDAVCQVVNTNASVRQTGFFDAPIPASRAGSLALWALSHMETFAVYAATDKAEESDNEGEDDAAQEFGDIREAWNCEYVVGIDMRHRRIAVGSNSTSKLSLIPFSYSYPSLSSSAPGVAPRFVPEFKHRSELLGAHGEEVVRCVEFGADGIIYSGGEDGIVKCWKEQKSDEHSEEPLSAGKQNSRRSHKRFAPY